MDSELKQLYVKTREEWRLWLEKHHSNEKGIYLLYFKKHTGQPRIPYDDAVEEAICFGWIDSLVKRIDDDTFMQKFTPRKENSLWSELNKKRVEKMIADGKMMPAGMRIIQAAKKNGKWDEITDAKKEFTISDYLYAILKSNNKALRKFEMLSPSQKKNYTIWIMSAKKEETSERRMLKMIEMFEAGKMMF